MANQILTAERLRELLHYDAGTGIFTWLPRSPDGFKGPRASAIWHSRYCGRQAGGVHATLGYVEIMRCLAHRLAFLYITGSWPVNQVDHIDGDKANNRWENLRDVTQQVNGQNLRVAHARKKTPLGVSYLQRLKGKPYAASISMDGLKQHLGYYATPSDAHSAYLSAKRAGHVGCTI